MALKDRFNIVEIKTDNEKIKEQVIQETVVEADLEPVIDELAGSLSQKVASIPVWFEYSETEQRKLISDFLNNKLETTYSDISFSNDEKEDIITLFMNSIIGFGGIDYYISREDVQSVLVNEHGRVYIYKENSNPSEDADIPQMQFENIYSGIHKRINMKDSAVASIRLNNMRVTVFAPPFCEKKILFEKFKTDKVDFDYLIKDGSISDKNYELITRLITDKKNILIAGASGCGKTAFLTAAANELSKNSRIAILENYPMILSEDTDKYTINGLNEHGLFELQKAVKKLKYDYIVNDTCNTDTIFSSNINGGVWASIDAETTAQTVTKLSAYRAYNEKCTEKLAKAYLAENYNYIIQLEEDKKSLFKISSISELSLNKSGSLMLTEVL